MPAQNNNPRQAELAGIEKQELVTGKYKSRFKATLTNMLGAVKDFLALKKPNIEKPAKKEKNSENDSSSDISEVSSQAPSAIPDATTVRNTPLDRYLADETSPEEYENPELFPEREEEMDEEIEEEFELNEKIEEESITTPDVNLIPDAPTIPSATPPAMSSAYIPDTPEAPTPQRVQQNLNDIRGGGFQPLRTATNPSQNLTQNQAFDALIALIRSCERESKLFAQRESQPITLTDFLNKDPKSAALKNIFSHEELAQNFAKREDLVNYTKLIISERLNIEKNAPTLNSGNENAGHFSDNAGNKIHVSNVDGNLKIEVDKNFSNLPYRLELPEGIVGIYKGEDGKVKYEITVNNPNQAGRLTELYNSQTRELAMREQSTPAATPAQAANPSQTRTPAADHPDSSQPIPPPLAFNRAEAMKQALSNTNSIPGVSIAVGRNSSNVAPSRIETPAAPPVYTGR